MIWKHRVLSLVLVIGSIGVFAPAVQAATYYVSPSGNNSNVGSVASPWLTIQKAADTMNPGDTTIVEDGVYTGSNCGATDAVVCVQRGGTAGNWVTFRARNKWGAKIDGVSNTTKYGFFLVTANLQFVEIDGFEIYGIGATAGATAIYIGGAAGQSDVRVLRNYIHDIGRFCDSVSGFAQAGIFTRHPRIHIEGNLFHTIGRFMDGENGCSTADNGRHDHAIYMCCGGGVTKSDYFTAINNVFYGPIRGYHIDLATNQTPWTHTDVLVAGNTFGLDRDQVDPYLLGYVIWEGIVHNLEISNNIFYDPQDGAIQRYNGTASGNNMIVRNNLVYGTANLFTPLQGTPPGVNATGNIFDNPDFVSVTAPIDLTLQATSPAINAGVTIAVMTKDALGVNRPQGAAYDIGAYEHDEATAPPPPDIPNATGDVFVSAAFAGATGTDLTAYTGEVGATFVAAATSTDSLVLTDANRARSTTTGYAAVYASGVPLSAEYDVVADFRVFSLIAGNTYLLHGRMSTTQQTSYFVLYNATSATFYLQMHTNGTHIPLTSAAYTLTVGQTYSVRLLIRNTSLSVKVDSVPILYTTNATIVDAGRAGLSINSSTTADTNSTGIHIDNLLVTDVQEAPGSRRLRRKL